MTNLVVKGDDLFCEAATLKPHDHVTNARSCNKLKSFYLCFQKIYSHWTWQGADITEELQHEIA